MPGLGEKIMMQIHSFRWLVAIVFIMGLCGATLAQDNAASEQITLIVGRSTVVRSPWPTVRVAVTDPKVADVQVLTPQQVLVQGLKVGTTDLILWSEDEQQTWQQRVTVRLDLESIRNSLQRLFPTAELEVNDSGEVLLVQGLLRSTDQVAQLSDYLEKSKIPYVDMTSLAGVQQVQLQVRVAEVSRAAIRQLGIDMIHTSDDFFFGQRIGQMAPGIGPAGQTFANPSDFDNLIFDTQGGGTGTSITLFGGFPNADLEFFLQALAENQYMRLLANPTLVALSGEEASFLAGGEFPIPVPQGGGAGVGGQSTITIEYKEFGVRLLFRPLVLGDGGIRLHASQEVSELTQVGAIRLGEYVIPALTTRRAEATLELKSGQCFAMAGLLQNSDSATNSRIPGLGDLPVLGPLFRSVRYQNQETELVILVTASLVEPMSLAQAPPLPGVTHTAPDDWELYLEGRLEGKAPARIDPTSREWLKQMGLDELAGPGAWDSYEN
jgi:pilus assembly protein CpaC